MAIRGIIGSRQLGRWLACLAGALLAIAPAGAQTRDPNRRLTPEQLAQMQHKHPGQAGALDPANLAKKRAKPPFDITGTWFVDLSEGFNKFMFGPPYPEFLPDAAKAYAESQQAALRSVHTALSPNGRFICTIASCVPVSSLIVNRVIQSIVLLAERPPSFFNSLC